jgi:hypothetical protein
VLGDGFDVGEAGVVLVRGDRVAAASAGSGVMGVEDGLAWGAFFVVRVALRHCVVEGGWGWDGMDGREEEEGEEEEEEKGKRAMGLLEAGSLLPA